MKTELPIQAIQKDLYRFLEAQTTGTPARLILEAPTGSGKSTQLGQFLLDAPVRPSGLIIVLQPRRIAARMLASYVARTRGGKLGEEVGYHVRMDRKASASTRLLFVTEGILLRMLLSDPALRQVSTVILDEFHERHLDGDLALASLLKLQENTRKDLQLIIMSATLPGDELEEKLAPCTRLNTSGRTYPVEICYSPPRALKPRPGRLPGEREPMWMAAGQACAALSENPAWEGGNMLVFMPGSFEIRKTIDTLQADKRLRAFDVVPLHGELTPAQQDSAVKGGTRPRIIVSTNVAETSLTIDGVTAVIDSGLARIASYDPARGINTLTVCPISQASADQRAGRAGRTAPGQCVRLWREAEHANRRRQEIPEIHRVDLSEAFLLLRAARLGDPMQLPWIDPPQQANADLAHSLLEALGATSEGELTSTGEKMASFPLHPRFSRMLLAAAEVDAVALAAACAALTSGRDLFLRGRGAKGAEHFVEDGDFSDFQPRLRAYAAAVNCRFDPSTCSRYGIHANAAREAQRDFERLCSSAKRQRLPLQRLPPEPKHHILGQILLASFSDQVCARADSGTANCRVVGNRSGQLDKGSVVKKDPLFVATGMIEIEGKDLQVRINNATALERNWLAEHFPEELSEGSEHVFDTRQRRVIQRRSVRFRDLTLEAKEAGQPELEAAAEILAAEIAQGNLKLKRWDAKVEQWIARVNALADWVPDTGITALRDDDLNAMLGQICLGAISYREIKDRDPWPELHSWLNPAQLDALEKLAPERIDLASGRSAKVTYHSDGPPRIGATVQHLYDQRTTPTVAGGKIPILVEVLGPNQRPVQVTDDLARFWKESYPEVRKQLRGRYPKHEWR